MPLAPPAPLDPTPLLFTALSSTPADEVDLDVEHGVRPSDVGLVSEEAGERIDGDLGLGPGGGPWAKLITGFVSS
jgi:hypothetical protein